MNKLPRVLGLIVFAGNVLASSSALAQEHIALSDDNPTISTDGKGTLTIPPTEIVAPYVSPEAAAFDDAEPLPKKDVEASVVPEVATDAVVPLPVPPMLLVAGEELPATPAPVSVAPLTPLGCIDAKGVAYPCKPEPKKERYRYLGMQFDIGLPSGVALGVVGRVPQVPWFKLGLAATGTLMPGIRGNVMFDPIKFGVAPVANIDLGHQFPFAIPGVKNSPDIGFSYVDLNAGLAFGNRDKFRFLLLSGYSYLFGSASNFQALITSAPKGLTLANPTFTGWIPNLKLGFEWLF